MLPEPVAGKGHNEAPLASSVWWPPEVVKLNYQLDRLKSQLRDAPLGGSVRAFPGKITEGKSPSLRVGGIFQWGSRQKEDCGEMCGLPTCLPFLLVSSVYSLSISFQLPLRSLTTNRTQLLYLEDLWLSGNAPGLRHQIGTSEVSRGSSTSLDRCCWTT